MRRIVKRPPPNSFVTYRNKPGARYDGIDSKTKDDLLTSLLNEQGWVCGYCQQKIPEKRKAKIEHHCEQSICNGIVRTPDRRLDYTNLMVVCLGHDGLGNFTCDANKSRFDVMHGLPIDISPWSNAHMNAIRYSRSGQVGSSIIPHIREIDHILNLNTSRLKDLRKSKFSRIWKESLKHDRTINKDKMRRIIQSEIGNISSKFDLDFPGLSEYMLKKYC